MIPADSDVLVLQTMRSHDQWNTTIYSNDDRYRGVKNLRELIFLNEADMAARGIAEGDFVDIVATSKDGTTRSLHSTAPCPTTYPGAAPRATCRR
ncbi:MAG: molybdopterin dinucleotide binding domain-containing protein [Propionibacteriaceae bacterium]